MNLPKNKILIVAAVFVVVFLITIAGAFLFLRNNQPPDNKKPQLHLTNIPEDQWVSTNEDSLKLEGYVSDENDIKEIKWETQSGISGITNASGNILGIEKIPLEQGDNTITIAATDTGGNKSTVVIKVVYNPEVLFSNLSLSQDFIYKDDFATEITARAQVETTNSQGLEKVELFKIVGGQAQVLTDMLDNGVVDNGDDIPGDAVFSGKNSFSSTNNQTIQLRIGAKINGVNDILYSGILEIKVLDKPSQDSLNNILDTNKKLNNRFAQLQKEMGPKEAVGLFVEELNTRGDIDIAGAAEDGFGVWWRYAETGVLAGINNNPKGTRAKTEEQRKKQNAKTTGQTKGVIDALSPINFGVSQTFAQSTEEKPEVKSTKAVYLGPYLADFGGDDDYHKAWQVIKNSKCPECQTTEKKDKAVTVADFKTLSQYGIIIIPSHGDTWFNGAFAQNCIERGACPASLQTGRGFVVVWTNQQVNQANLIKYLPDLVNYRLALDASDNTLAILPPFISTYNGNFPNSLVYIGACRSTHNFSMAAAFISKGAKAYLGFSEYVDSLYAGDVADEVFKGFIDEEETISQAFSNAVKAEGDGDTNTPRALFNFFGSPNLVMGGRNIQNASFEESLVGWQTEGDSRVITRLNNLKPQDGEKMAIISTGLGSVNQSNSAFIQKICVSQGTLTLSFKYNFVSEEPTEFFGSVFDDNFTMTVTINGKRTTVVQRTINNSSWKKISGINFAGGDNTTYHTGWKSVVKDLGEVQPDDKVEIEFRVSDRGDSIYDTAALIDSVKLEVTN